MTAPCPATAPQDGALTTHAPAANRCLVCDERRVEVVLDLGETAPANNFLLPRELARAKESTFPLRLGLCRACGHVQLTEFVPPSQLFDHYLYMSSASSTLTSHLRDLAATMVARLGIRPQDLVVDIGCNDGTLLEGFAMAGIDRRIGVDPAANLAAVARARGADVVTGYFGPEVAASIVERHGVATAITMTNTFPHIPDLPALMRSLDLLLAEQGAVVLEAHYLVDLLEMCAFDTVYHEHVSYWALAPMARLFAAHGFEIFDVARLPIHHGQLRAWVGRTGRRPVSDSVAALLEAERARQIGQPAPYRRLAGRIARIRSDLIALIHGVRAAGGRVAGYGAPAKGSTLLSYFGLGTGDLDFIADRNPLKQGRLTPGSHIPIVEPERILRDRPDLVVVLAWNFAEEIAEQLSPYVRAGGRLVVPVPHIREIGGQG